MLDEIEKEEAVALKAYVRLAIANFAADDSALAPPRIPSQLQTTKANGYGSRKDKDIEKKSRRNSSNSKERSLKALSLPKIPSTNEKEKTWATVARHDQKKARVTPTTKTQAAPMSKLTQLMPVREKSTLKDPSEKRLFFRIPKDHQWYKLSPAGIREVIVQELYILPSPIGRIRPKMIYVYLMRNWSQPLNGLRYRPNSRRCLARPTRAGVPTKKQMKTYCQAGEREYLAVLLAVLLAKTVEESAESAEKIKIDLLSSQESEIDTNNDNMPASATDNLTGGALRL
ncbi:hypothetical protein EPUL_000930 [Erysiphe pulchra]|uniref:Uncharacterized protein n=1 Tax=Erysiphe pulchra TaxID=225359 RepID=A0A2S4Q298_9PEZI|nr:hypothetical protein EPUL_000930 [Erysiphe pulchra]